MLTLENSGQGAANDTQSVAPAYSCACAACVGGGKAASLMAGTRWTNGDSSDTTVLSYSFSSAQNADSSAQAHADNSFHATLQEFSDSDKAQVRTMLDGIEAVCKIRFVEVPDSGDGGTIRYGYSQEPSRMAFAGMAFYPSDAPQAGDVWLASSQSGSEWDYYRPYLLLHETLHALGLKHPFTGANTLSTQDDFIGNTVMSYSAMAGSQSGALSKYPTQPMALDIAALQALYGSADHNTGNTVYNLADPRWHDGFQVIWDSGGTDKLDASTVTNAVQLDLAGGAHSFIGNVVFAYARFTAGGVTTSQHASYADTLVLAQDTLIENATGSAFDDFLLGNDRANRLEGGDGNDGLTGRGGNDLLVGGGGIDTASWAGARSGYIVVRSGDQVIVTDKTGAEGTDALIGVERLDFSDYALAFDLGGNAGRAAEVARSVWGPASLADKGKIGNLIAAADSGLTGADLAQWALDHPPGPAMTNEMFVKLVYHNVTGVDPGPGEFQHYFDMLTVDHVSQAALASYAAECGANTGAADLVGLAQTGLAYLPLA